MTTFSLQLITRLQEHFKQRFGLDITSEQAIEYLHSLAGLFLVFVSPPD
jgi:hypothetical protein